MMVEKNTSMINKSQIVHLRSLWHQTIQSLKFAGDFASVSPGERIRLDKRDKNNRVHVDVDGTGSLPSTHVNLPT